MRGQMYQRRPKSPPWRRYLAGAVAATLLCVPALAFAAPRWVSARYLVVRAGQDSRSATVTTLRHGDAVELLKTEGSFGEVRTKAGAGWVATRWLVATKPGGGGGLLARYGAAARSGGGDVGTTAGARGLSPEAERYAVSKAALADATKQLLWLEAIEITDEVVDAFLRDGGLGDYQAVQP